MKNIEGDLASYKRQNKDFGSKIESLQDKIEEKIK